MAYNGASIIGHLGLLPCEIRVDGAVEKFYWLSALYVSPNARNTLVGLRLIRSALKLGYALAATNASDESQAVYRAFSFYEPPPLTYLVIDSYQLNLQTIPLRLIRKFLNRNGRAYSLIENAIYFRPVVWNRLIYSTIAFSFSNWSHGLSIESRRDIDDRSFDVELDQAAPVRFCRNADVINWMISSPWVTTNLREKSPDYYFGDYREYFEYELLRIRGKDDGQYMGFVVIQVKQYGARRELHVLDYFIKGIDISKTVTGLALQYAGSYGVDRVYLPNICEAELGHRLFPKALLTRVHRPYFWLYPSFPTNELRE